MAVLFKIFAIIPVNMKCPKCGKKMKLDREDFSYNYDVKPKKKYKRKLFVCESDDIWVSIEEPVSKK